MPQNDTSIWINIGIKAAGLFVSFVGGIITATWIVANKVKAYELRISTIETAQSRCQVETLGEIKGSLERISNKLDEIPTVIDDRLTRAHERIDKIIIDKK